MDVVIHQENDEFDLSPVCSMEVVKCGYSEEPGGKVLAKEKVFRLTDEM